MYQLLRVIQVSVLLAIPSLATAIDAPRPNILWITAEDMSPTLGCYGDEYATSPNIDRLASESVRYTHAFATAPVCSPVRSSLITGCYATSLGTHNMRSAFPVPDSIHGFPSYLRGAGYYTTNNVKTDYNTSSWERLVEESWDESSNTAHWRNRPKEDRDKPFFSVFNLMTSHQSRSMVWTYDRFVKEVQGRLSPEEIHSPHHVRLPPYYPDSLVIRKTVARFYDCVTAMDKEVGAILQQLEDDGLAEDTIVFFFSDHGSGMPRHKRALLDSGMHVPLLIRFPEKYQHLAPTGSGSTTDRLVSFVDFPPTVLNLASVDTPNEMQGLPFLGGEVSTDAAALAERTYAFGHRDRVDEAMDTARSVRDKRYLYIRNYMPHLSYNQPTAWPDLGEIRHEFYRLTNPQTMTKSQWHFAGPSRPVEELYDCLRDPLNQYNLAESEEHAATLQRLREELDDHMRESLDLGFIPEPVATKLFQASTPWDAARQRDFRSHIDALNAAGLIARRDAESLNEWLHLDDPLHNYWAAIAAAGRQSLTVETPTSLKQLLENKSPAVRIAAADALARHGELDLAVPVLIDAVQNEDLTVVLYAARTIELLGESARAAVPAMHKLLERAERLQPSDTPATFVQSGDQDLAMFASFSARAFLDRLE